MRHAKSGFTMFELMIVIAIIALVATIAIPALLESKKLSNERVVPATLKSIRSNETIFRERAFLDVDTNETGEYGPLLDATLTVDPSNINDLLDMGLSFPVDPAGYPEKTGYLYTIYVPAVASDAEQSFLAVAWPKKYGKTGELAFAMPETGVTHKAENLGGAVASGSGDPVALNEFYGTSFDNNTILTATWSVVK